MTRTTAAATQASTTARDRLRGSSSVVRSAAGAGATGAGPTPPVRPVVGTDRRQPGRAAVAGLQRAGQLARVGQAALAGPGQAAARGRSSSSRSWGTPARTWRGWHGGVVGPGGRRERGDRLAGPPGGQGGVEHGADPVDVALGRPPRVALADAAGGRVHGQPGDLELAVGGAQHVLRLQAQVGQPGVVGGADRLGQLGRQCSGLRRPAAGRRPADRPGRWRRPTRSRRTPDRRPARRRAPAGSAGRAGRRPGARRRGPRRPWTRWRRSGTPTTGRASSSSSARQ